MSFGFRIGPARPAVSQDIIERFKTLPTANISDSMNRIVGGGTRIRPMGRAAMTGTALAVKTAPGDNLMVHKAISMAKPGEIIVIDAGGDVTNSILGERMVTVAHERGVAGLIINGAVRDLETLKVHDMPVFAAGVTHRGPYRKGPGEINYPIAIDGMVIESGDVIVADEDGFLCIPFRDAEKVCAAAEKKAEQERTTAPKSNPAKLDEQLRELGCEFVE